jgi:hypothetical protein
MAELRYPNNIYKRALYHQNKREGTAEPVHPLVSGGSFPFVGRNLMTPEPPAKELSAIDRRTQFLARNREEQASKRKYR